MLVVRLLRRVTSPTCGARDPGQLFLVWKQAGRCGTFVRRKHEHAKCIQKFSLPKANDRCQLEVSVAGDSVWLALSESL